MGSEYEVSNKNMKVHLLAGAFSKLVTDLAMFPLDTVKTKLQFTHNANQSIANRSHGIVNTIFQTFKSSGIRGLYKGFIPHTLYVIPASSISFLCYEAVLSELKKSKKRKQEIQINGGNGDILLKHSNKEGSGGRVLLAILGMTLARVSGSIIRTPFDVVKMRQQVSTSLEKSQGNKVKYTSQIILSILKKDGVKGLFKFSYVSLLRDLPFSAIYFSSYEISRNYQKSYYQSLHQGEILSDGSKKKEKLSALNNLLSGAFAGAVATIFTIPLDVIKTNLQTQDVLPKKDRVFKGVFSTLSIIIKNEGLKGLTKGLGTRLIHIIPSAGLSFASYEYFKKILSTMI
ncbi:mitochondrial substrate carrier family protein [Tieghemostelium lacteum]|uniref:Mitochondrial substrate carrier family protein n=1 Tax=Tieghemostelium lacteum TaxID=361077 RepID=A0A151Z3Q9_TIELA|nr:mitochondrial substrate carrier family protein [Tieghemostelium lacteum]|eukprot:KYQ88596.1 mitochondrial substrate carrier family protein [Tieghemostelium lacteum]